MRKGFMFFFVLFLFGICISVNAQTVVEGRYIVRFVPESAALRQATRAQTIEAKQEALKKNIDSLTNVIKSPTIKNLEPLWIANCVALDAGKEEIERIGMLHNVAEVIPVTYEIFIDKDIDKKAVKSGTDAIQWGVQRVRAHEVWQDFKIDGTGVVVGVIDTGIYGDHPAFADRILAFKDFTRDGYTEPHDGQGHGTHVAGSVAGGQGIGVAPGATLIIGRVFDRNGGTTTDVLMAAMQWMLDPDGDPKTNDAPRVINNSWGSNSSTNTAFWDAVKSWADVDILPVFAAGNNGTYGGKVGTPAAFPHSWAVAATTNTDALAYFSSVGPVYWEGEMLMKPDIAAPGHQIVSCDQKGGLVSNSGTSMAAPHVAGVAALMLQADPSLSIAQMRMIAEETALDLGEEGKDTKFGSGLIDAHKIVGKVLENAMLASAYEAYETAVHAEKALIGTQIVSPLAEPLARSIVERTTDLDEGQFNALSVRVSEEMTESAQALLKAAAAARAIRLIHR